MMRPAWRSRGAVMMAAAALSVVPAGGAQAQTPAGWLSMESAQEYRSRARYPRDSWALSPGQGDPLRAKRTPARQSFGDPDGTGPTLTLWAGKVSFEHPAPVDLFASLARAGQAAAAEALAGEIATEAGETIGTVTYRDDGLEADRRAGDGIYSARATFLAEREPALAESYLVRVQARLADGSAREGVTGFLYSRPWARLTGRYRDSREGGTLLVSLEVEVQRSGRFHLAGTLHSTTGEPIGVAQTSASLPPGRHRMVLSFFGLMFHDRRVSGRFRVGTLALSTTSGMPNAFNDLVEDAHTTRAYGLSGFVSRPFDEPGFLAAARRLEAEAARSRRDAAAEEGPPQD